MFTLGLKPDIHTESLESSTLSPLVATFSIWAAQSFCYTLKLPLSALVSILAESLIPPALFILCLSTSGCVHGVCLSLSFVTDGDSRCQNQQQCSIFMLGGSRSNVHQRIPNLDIQIY